MSISSRIEWSSTPTCAATSLVSAAVTGLLVLLAGTATAQPAVPAIRPDGDTPIELDAEYSELDRRNNRLAFRQLNIRQGTLQITAAEAVADPADFTNSVWTFTGNVVLRSAGTTSRCSKAEMTFRDNQLQQAILSGEPAEFAQQRDDGQPPTEGRGQRMEYDIADGTIRISGDAWLSDGKNEISGARIAYDLQREVVTAGADGNGQVRMKITPREE